MSHSALIKAVASALAADDGREVFASDYPRAVRFINRLGDLHVTVDHDPPIPPMDFTAMDAAIARIRQCDVQIARLSPQPAKEA